MEETIIPGFSWHSSSHESSGPAGRPSPRLSICYACGHLSESRAHVPNDGFKTELHEHSQHIPTDHHHRRLDGDPMTDSTIGYTISKLSQAETRLDGSWLVNPSGLPDWRARPWRGFLGFWPRPIVKLPTSNCQAKAPNSRSIHSSATLVEISEVVEAPVVRRSIACDQANALMGHFSNGSAALSKRSEVLGAADDAMDEFDENDGEGHFIPHLPQPDPDPAEFKYIYRFVCKKCGDHKHQTNNCQSSDHKDNLVGGEAEPVVEATPTKQEPLATDIDEYKLIFKDIGIMASLPYYKGVNTWWRDIMVFRGESGPDTPYHCRFCKGDYTNPKGQCAVSKTAVNKHCSLLKLLNNWMFRRTHTKWWLQRLRVRYVKHMKIKYPTLLDWTHGSPEMPEAMAYAFDNEFGQPEKLKELEDDAFVVLLNDMEKRGVRYAEQASLEISDAAKARKEREDEKVKIFGMKPVMQRSLNIERKKSRDLKQKKSRDLREWICDGLWMDGITCGGAPK